MNAPTNAVVLGVGADGFDEALGFATRRGSSHSSARCIWSTSSSCRPARPTSAAYGGALDIAKAMLAEATAKAEELAGDDVPVTAELIDNGWVVDDLVRRTERSCRCWCCSTARWAASGGSSCAPRCTASPGAPRRR